MKKLINYISFLLLVSLFSVGCGNASQPTQAPSSSNTQTSGTPSETPPAKSDNLGAKLSNAYADMMKNNKYYMKYKMTSTIEGQSTEIESTVAVSGDNMAVSSIMKGMSTTMIFKADKTYIINHTQKTVMEMPRSNSQKNSKSNAIKADGLTYVSSGVEDGLTYEKYSTTTGVIKYYFDGKKLLKIAVESDGKPMVMNIIEMSNNVSDNMFEIPADYQKSQLPS